jgi:hypothetical protein
MFVRAVDAAQGTAVVLQLLDTPEDMRKGAEAFSAMDRPTHPAPACPPICANSRSTAR